MQVPTRELAHDLQKIVGFAMKHVYSCGLCTQKGFICEICSNPKEIYPFELDTTYRVRIIFLRATVSRNI